MSFQCVCSGEDATCSCYYCRLFGTEGKMVIFTAFNLSARAQRTSLTRASSRFLVGWHSVLLGFFKSRFSDHVKCESAIRTFSTKTKKENYFHSIGPWQHALLVTPKMRLKHQQEAIDWNEEERMTSSSAIWTLF